MRYPRRASLALVVVVLAACMGSEQDPALTGPDEALRLAANAKTSYCDVSYGRAIDTEQRSLFSKPTLDTAKTLWAAVAEQCAVDSSAAREAMLAYVRFTIKAEASNRVNGTNPANGIVRHWDLTFPYVKYPKPDLDAVVLTNDGAAHVVLASEGSTASATPVIAQEFGIPAKAAMTFYKQTSDGDQRGHLFTITPAGVGCLTTNLRQAGDCFEFSSFPNVSTSANEVFSPAVKLGICYESSTLANPALGHGIGSTTVIPQTPGTSYPSPAYCHDVEDPPVPQFGGVFGPIKQLAYRATRVFSVRNAYAGHGGLGGVTQTLSPFGAVDLQVFYATFQNTSVGSAPAENAAFTAPEVGSWDSVDVTAPGSILVQSALGNLGAQPVVLSQGGGNCVNCGGLKLAGLLSSSAPSSYASNGIYKVTWQSLQNGPTVKSAPFVLTSSTGQVIATVEYAQESSVNLLKFNGVTLQTLDTNNQLVPLTWVRNAAQTFEITVDLDNDVASLKVGGVSPLPSASTQNVPFTAANFAMVSARFTGIDSGIVGWDNIIVSRLAGQ